MPDRKPSPEVKQAIREFVRVQREKYGDDWKERLSAEMTNEAMPVLRLLFPGCAEEDADDRE